MHQLSSSTVHLLSSAQVITAVVSVVKELVENALDACATNIEVKLENFGFDKIEVRDNGIGIKAADTPVMGIKHYTSKISSHEDLESLQTYGFRGEALCSICSVAEVHISTKTATDPVSTQYVLDNNGHVVSEKPSHLGQGTTVSVMKLFKNLPVRKQYYSTAKKCKEELKKIQDLLISYGLIKPDVRIVLVHNKVIVWQKNKVSNHKMALISVLGTTVMNAMTPFQHQCENPEIFINGYLPRPEADRTLTSVHGPEKSFIFINQRPVLHKDILKIVRLYYNERKDFSHCYPVFFMNILVPASSVDVNVTPDKTQVLLHNKEFVLQAVENVLKSVYTDTVTVSVCKPEAQSKNINTKYIEYPSTDEQKKNNSENSDRGEQTVSLSPENNKNNDNSERELQSHVYLKHQSSSRDQSLNVDFAGKECPEAYIISSSSNQGNQSDYTLRRNQKVSLEIEVLKNIAPSDKHTVTDDDWSRGHSLRNATGEDLQPVMILSPSNVSHVVENVYENLDKTCNENTNQKSANIITEKFGFITAYDLMNNQVIRKPMSAIQIFTQEYKAKFLKDSPVVQFDEIPSVISELWEHLSEEDKLRYEEKATKDLQRYNSQTAKAVGETKEKAKETGEKIKLTLNKIPQKIKLKTPMSNQQILNKLFHSQVQKKAVVLTVKTIKIDFSLCNLKQQLCNLGRKEMLDFGELTVISKLNLPGAWIVASKNDIALLNPYRVEEALLYKRLLKDHKIPVDKLDLPIILNDRLVGGPKYFTALLSMQKDSPRPNGHIYFSDVRLTYNGFQIKMMPGSSNFTDHVEIEAITKHLPFFGITDLKEVLSSVVNGNKNLWECRPLKVLNYLEGEAVRLARQLPLNLSKLDVINTVHRMKKQLSGNQKECIHGRPFFHQLSDIPESDD
ncbi:PMS1 protein homolog 1 isoform X1 [Bufo bufo]|uniref:PMS1 protein homolog 1 isoform X1 n=2 Tax=Bufo bufo TaxID=8384 RepID=UPI001ABE556B|nr:PMS1 protein homolog 1 isoform X1 [Bufo bufo]XP_040295845.1 PMS1 protein homolog 1 isoform X1 [Bufo bufo]